ncbi:MAG: YraN family protein [Anaerolineae bacterium]
MTGRRQTGQHGEEIVARYFAGQGYTIVARNWRCAVGELDLVLEKESTLVFVEVRTRRSARYGSPEESVTAAKQAKLVELAHTYLQQLPPPHPAWRIDVAAVWLRPGHPPRVNHIENAVGW